MMEHIRQRDWCQRRTTDEFVDEADIDNCVIERIIGNSFWDPLISSDDEEPARESINWSSVFKKNKTFEKKQYKYQTFVPGLRTTPNHPKISALTKEDHRQCMRVICAINKSILPQEFLGRPIKADYAVFEKTKEIYAKEQKEYLEWANNLWVTTNCIRALRPKPLVEMIYDAEFKMKVQKLQLFSNKFTSAAQIPLRADNHKCEIILPEKDLIKVNNSEIPKVSYPMLYEERVTILHACPMPKPCDQHPCRFKLPNESTESLLPLPEIHNELAQFALDNGANFIASENAIKCLLETDRTWTVPISVCEAISADGDTSNIVVLGNDFPLKKDSAPMRSYLAYKHLLLNAFTAKKTGSRTFTDENDNSNSRDSNLRSEPNSHYSRNTRNTTGQKLNSCGKSAKRNQNHTSDPHKAAQVFNDTMKKIHHDFELSDSEEEDRLQICVEGDNLRPEVFHFSAKSDKPKDTSDLTGERRNSDDLLHSPPRKILKTQPREHSQEDQNEMRLYDCACKDSDFEVSPPRSYKNWLLKNYTTRDQINVIIHCSHKLQNSQKSEVILEPIVEYQLDIGGTLQSQQKLQSLTFSMMLRKDTELTSVRVDGVTGEVVTIDTVCSREFSALHGDFREEVANSLYTTLNQLAGLLPGEYLLRHEPVHGYNAILFSSKSSLGLETISINWEDHQMPPAEDAKLVQIPPNLGPILLPLHKLRRQLPMAFTHDPRHVAKETHKLAKKRAPPAALQWPKRRGRKPKKRNNQTIVNN